MKRNKLIIVPFVISILAGCASSQLESSLGNTWRTETPENVSLGAYGIRTSTSDGVIFTQNGAVLASKLQIKATKVKTVSYHVDQNSNTELVPSQVLSIGRITMQELQERGGYQVLVTKVVNTKEIANQLANNQDDLDDGYLSIPSLRFITGIVQVYDQALFKEIKVGGNLPTNAIGNFDGTLDLLMNSGNRIELNTQDGYVIAYSYARICWNEDRSISYLQEEVPKPWYLFLSDGFECAEGTFEVRPEK